MHLFLHLTPNAKSTGLDRLTPDRRAITLLRARVTTPSKKGKANKTVIRFLAKKLGLPRFVIRIIAGHQSREKTLLISADSTLVLERLSRLLVESGLKINKGAGERS